MAFMLPGYTGEEIKKMQGCETFLYSALSYSYSAGYSGRKITAFGVMRLARRRCFLRSQEILQYFNKSLTILLVRGRDSLATGSSDRLWTSGRKTVNDAVAGEKSPITPANAQRDFIKS
jgi:hypothetical protein